MLTKQDLQALIDILTDEYTRNERREDDVLRSKLVLMLDSGKYQKARRRKRSVVQEEAKHE